MKQYEAVIQTLEKLGGQATLAELYTEVLKIKDCTWKTRTPFASIRRIVQVRTEIFKVRPGLWALKSCKKKLGLEEYGLAKAPDLSSHYYYQGLLISIGNLRGFATFVPNQDKNQKFVNCTLGEIRSLQQIPSFSYDYLVKKSSSVDVVWFNQRQMPDRFFEVEHSTDIQNSLLKFVELQDFHAQMIIVADEHRLKEFEYKAKAIAFNDINGRVKFLSYNTLAKQYEYESLKALQTYAI